MPRIPLALLVLLEAATAQAACAGEVPKTMDQPAQARQSLASDPQRPVYHYLPPSNWMNDPNGLIQFKGEYHLFYQYLPKPTPDSDAKEWGHAVSRDMVHWRDLPVALRPDKPWDEDGVWSGCIVNDNGTLTAVYTGVHPQVQCIATSRDLVTWEKPAGNPVIAGPPAGLDVVGFRDPFVWTDGAEWKAVIGTGIRDKGGAILLYRSKDLRTWEYLQPALVGDKAKTGDMWECPNFFALGDKWVLMVSTLGQSYHFVGTFKDNTFTPESEASTDAGSGLYAPLTFKDAKGRRILFGWLWEQRGDAGKYGWQGVQSLPRVITLGNDGRLRYAPAREVESLRGERARIKNISVTPGGSGFLNAVKGDAAEINARMEPGNADRCGLVIRRSPGGEEATRIVFDAKAGTLSVDRSKSSDDPTAAKDTRTAPLSLAAGEALELRMFIDHSVLEVFANGRTCLTARIYPTRPDSLGVDAFAEGGEAKIVSLDAWQMKPIWPVSPGR